MNIRADNEDSLQGPVRSDLFVPGPALWLAQNGFPMDTELSMEAEDGISLLEAYAFGLDPRLDRGGRLYVSTVESNRVGFSFYGANPWVEYVAETSVDLQRWTSEGVSITDPDQSGQRTAWVDRDSAARFLRLVVRLVSTEE